MKTIHKFINKLSDEEKQHMIDMLHESMESEEEEKEEHDEGESEEEEDDPKKPMKHKSMPKYLED